MTDAAERRTARLLASLILILVPVGLASAVVQLVQVPGFAPAFPLIATALLLLVGCYAIARTAYYRVAGVAAACVPVFAGGAVGLVAPADPGWFAFMTLGTLLASAFLELHYVAAIAGITVAATAAVLFGSGEYRGAGAVTAILSFTGIVSALTLVVARHRALLERDREASRRESQARYRILFENAPLGIGFADADGRLVEVNDAMLRPGGYDRTDMSPVRSVSELYYDPAERPGLLEKLAREGRLVGEEVRLRAKDGSPYDVALSVVPVTLGGKKHTLAISEDITVRKRAEAERARVDEERTYLAGVIEGSLNEIYLIDATTLKFEYANEGARRNIGYTLEQLQTLTAVDLKPEFSEASFRAAIEPLLRGETRLLSFETVHRRADGTRYPVEVRLQMAPRSGPARLLAIILDITPRRRAEEAARQDVERLRVAIDTAAITVFESDEQLRYTWIHRPRLGLTVDQVLGHTDEEIFGKDGAAIMAIKRRVLQTGRAERQEVDLRLGGRDWTFVLSVEARQSDSGERIGLRGASLDISELKRLQAQFFQAQKMESIGRLAGGVAHDFNNLLTVIGGNLALALAAVPPTDPVHRDLSDASKAAHSAATLTQQLLTFSRRQIIDPQVVNLNDAIDRAQQLLHRLIGEHIELRTLTSPHLGRVRFDPGQCEQVLINLAVNARDAMPDGGTLTLGTANVDLDESFVSRHPGATAGQYVVLTVSDTGSGMSPEVMQHLFEPFFTTKAPGVGTGLGLAMVDGAVSQNGGHIEVESEPGRGTTFRIYLPRVHAERVPRPAPSQEVVGGTESIVLVEDDDGVRLLASRMLRKLGYHVHAFRDGRSAVDAVRTLAEPLHLLLTDVVMPSINGRALAEQITAERPGIRVLYTSGYTADVVGRHGVLDDGVAFLAKPYSMGSLARRVRETLDGRGV